MLKARLAEVACGDVSKVEARGGKLRHMRRLSLGEYSRIAQGCVSIFRGVEHRFVRIGRLGGAADTHLHAAPVTQHGEHQVARNVAHVVAADALMNFALLQGGSGRMFGPLCKPGGKVLGFIDMEGAGHKGL